MLITCRECQNQVSDKAASCPKCGAPVALVPASPLPLVPQPPAQVMVVSQPPKRMGCLSWIGLAFLVLVVLALIPSGEKSEKDQGVTEQTTGEVTQKSMQQATPAMTTTVKQITKEYDSNEVAADLKYKGKIVEITGKLESINKMFGSSYLTIGPGTSFRDIQCSLIDGQDQTIAKLKPGTEVTIKGRVDGLLLLSVSVHDCFLMSWME